MEKKINITLDPTDHINIVDDLHALLYVVQICNYQGDMHAIFA